MLLEERRLPVLEFFSKNIFFVLCMGVTVVYYLSSESTKEMGAWFKTDERNEIKFSNQGYLENILHNYYLSIKYTEALECK